MRKLIGIFAVLTLTLLGPQWAKADSCNVPGTQLLANCDFETSSTLLTGWTLSGQSTSVNQFVGVDQAFPFQGGNDAFLSTDPDAAAGLPLTQTISQAVATTVGQLYNVSFELLVYPDPGGGNPNSFLATFGGLTLINTTNLSGASFPVYELFSGSFTATGTSTTLTFTGANEDSTFGIDDTSVTKAAAAPSVPEPGTFMLLGTGLVGLAGAVRRRLGA